MERKGQWSFIWLGLALALVGSACSSALPPDPPQAAGPPHEVPGEEDALGESIEVRGHWTITLRDPDGTVAATHEFDNRLQTPDTLGRILRRVTRVGWWKVLVESEGANICGDRAVCTLDENPVRRGPATFPLSLRSSDDGLTLFGNAEASGRASIGAVSTNFDECRPAESLAACRERLSRALGAFFTRHTLDPPIAVERGQIIQVEVRFVFAPG